MSTAAILLKQLRARNPKARADAVSGVIRLLREPGFAMAPEELALLRDTLKELLVDAELPNALVIQAVLRLPSKELKDEVLAHIRSDLFPLGIGVLRTWLPLLDAKETDEVLRIVRREIRHGNSSAHTFAVMRNMGLATPEDLDALALRICEYMESDEDSAHPSRTPVGELQEHLTKDEYAHLTERIRVCCGRELPQPPELPPWTRPPWARSR